MEKLFIGILNMSIASCILILFVILISQSTESLFVHTLGFCRTEADMSFYSAKRCVPYSGQSIFYRRFFLAGK